MSALAATATLDLASYAKISAVFGLVALGYLAWCAADPYGACRRCRGAGKTRAPLGRRLTACRRCDGYGIRLRTGRRFLNHLIKLHRAANRRR